MARRLLAAALPANPQVVHGCVPFVVGVGCINICGSLLARIAIEKGWTTNHHVPVLVNDAMVFSVSSAVLLILMLTKVWTQHIVLSFLRVSVLLSIAYDTCALMSLFVTYDNIAHKAASVSILALGTFILFRGGLLPYYWRERRWMDLVCEAVPVLVFIAGVVLAAHRMMTM